MLTREHKHTRQVLSLPSVLLSMYPLREMRSLNNAIVRSLTNIPIFHSENQEYWQAVYQA